jgi:enolase
MFDKKAEGKKQLHDFEQMKDVSELKALSNVSLERPLSEKEYARFRELADKVLYASEKRKMRNVS